MTDTAVNTVEIPAAGTYRVDAAGSTLTFRTRHLFGLAPVRGRFRLRSGHLTVADPVAASSALAAIDAGSVDTGNAARDRTVRSGQYLAAEEFPDITFASTGLERVDGRWVLRGTLTVRGAEAPLDVHVDAARVTGSRLAVRAHTRVDRYAVGVTAMKGMAGRYLDLRLELAAARG